MYGGKWLGEHFIGSLSTFEWVPTEQSILLFKTETKVALNTLSFSSSFVTVSPHILFHHGGKNNLNKFVLVGYFISIPVCYIFLVNNGMTGGYWKAGRALF